MQSCIHKRLCSDKLALISYVSESSRKKGEEARALNKHKRSNRDAAQHTQMQDKGGVMLCCLTKACSLMRAHRVVFWFLDLHSSFLPTGNFQLACGSVCSLYSTGVEKDVLGTNTLDWKLCFDEFSYIFRLA